MPRKTPLTPREAEICARLRNFRKTTGLSRVAFAQKAGIDSSILVRYEHGRVPLKYLHAWRFIRTFLLSPAWLATGDNGKWTRSAQFTPGPELLQMPDGTLFSEAYDRILSKPATAAGKQTATLTPAELRARYEWAFQHWVRDRLIELPDAAIPGFVEQLKAAGNSLLKKHPKDTAAVIAKRKAEYEAELDTDTRLRLQGTI